MSRNCLRHPLGVKPQPARRLLWTHGVSIARRARIKVALRVCTQEINDKLRLDSAYVLIAVAPPARETDETRL
jgi:hypothetical protein